VTVKDSFFVKGVDSSVGIASLAFKPASEDAPLVDLLRSLGAVIIAKTNIPQTMGFLDSVNHLFGRTLNPRNRRLTPGGSSGGEGVVVAMRGSMIGFGTDVGGSIRIPAMCNGIYGFKPSDGRLPYGGQNSGQPAGKGRVALKAVAGPLGRSVADIETVMKEIVPRAELFGEDCLPGQWQSERALISGPRPPKFTVGILRSDNLIVPLPPVAKVIEEVSQTLRRAGDIEVVEITPPPLMRKCQEVANRLMGVDGGGPIQDLIAETSEPLMPYLQRVSKRRPPLTMLQLYQLYADRATLEKDMRQMWKISSDQQGQRHQTIDAIVLPVAPHPVPEIDRWGPVSYTSTFVLCDYPAGTIPVRDVTEADLKLEFDDQTKNTVWSGSDRHNRQLCTC
jgi:Asp-tRNA(Asn)/Glu-tRNA(Gln) amidotransferase A subunit family amidase